MFPEHPGRAAGEIPAASCGENWKRNFEVCKQGRKDEAATPPKSLIAALTQWQSSFCTVGVEKAKCQFDLLREKILKRFETCTPLAQMPGEEQRREENEEEQEQRKASQQMGPPAPGGAMKAFQRCPVFDPARFRGASGECGGSGNLDAPGFRKRSLSRSPCGDRRPMEEDASL